MPDPSSYKLPWYKTGLGVALLGFAALLVCLAGSISFLTAKYWWQIKHGGAQAPILVGSGFTALPQSAVKAAASYTRAQIETADNPFLGRPTAPVVIVEFVDFLCPNCQIAAPIMKNVMSQFGYKTKFIVRYFPAESIHPGAGYFTELALCADAQGKFWPVSDWLFSNQNSLPNTAFSPAELANFAAANSLNINQLNTCLSTPATKEKVNKDYLDGIRFGVSGTPTFFVNGTKVEGVVSLEKWSAFLK